MVEGRATFPAIRIAGHEEPEAHLQWRALDYVLDPLHGQRPGYDHIVGASAGRSRAASGADFLVLCDAGRAPGPSHLQGVVEG